MVSKKHTASNFCSNWIQKIVFLLSLWCSFSIVIYSYLAFIDCFIRAHSLNIDFHYVILRQSRNYCHSHSVPENTEVRKAPSYTETCGGKGQVQDQGPVLFGIWYAAIESFFLAAVISSNIGKNRSNLDFTLLKSLTLGLFFKQS